MMGMAFGLHQYLKKENRMNIKADRKNIRFTLAVFMFLLLVSSCVFQIMRINQPEIVKVKNIFADVNGDGILDINLKGDIILNSSSSPQTNF